NGFPKTNQTRVAPGLIGHVGYSFGRGWNRSTYRNSGAVLVPKYWRWNWFHSAGLARRSHPKVATVRKNLAHVGARCRGSLASKDGLWGSNLVTGATGVIMPEC